MAQPEFIDREQAFLQTPALASFVRELQEALLRPQEFAEGESVWLDSGDAGPTVLSAAQAATLNAEMQAEFARLRDPIGEHPREMKGGAEIVAQPDCRTMRGIGGAMKRHLRALATDIGMDRLVVLPLARQPITSQVNRHPPAANARRKLVEAGFVDTRASTGPLEVMAELFGPLFWIARCNASAPQILFAFAGHDLIGMLCKYGNVHFTPYGDVGHATCALRRSGFEIPSDGHCQVRFAGRRAISGRRIEL